MTTTRHDHALDTALAQTARLHRKAIPITLRPNVLVDTGRASYGDVIHQLPRGGGVRDCFIPRPGHVLCSCDYGGLELSTHAQNCINTVGFSKLAEALNSGLKVHDALAATFLGISYQEFQDGLAGKQGPKIAKLYKAVRQAVKPANFGFPGGMGAVKLVLQQRKQGPDTPTADYVKGPNGETLAGKIYKGLRFCVLTGAHRCGVTKVVEWKKKSITPTCEECIRIAEDIRAKWFAQWPENEPYFEFVADCVDNGQRVYDYVSGKWLRLRPAQVRQHRSGRLRGEIEFCSGANGFFQGLAGDGAKLALTRVSRECYDRSVRLPDGSPSPLYGCRIILFAHDELILEMPEAIAHLAAARVSVLMIAAMREFTPDVEVTAPPALARRWFKGMEPVYHRGILVPWEPDHDSNKCELCAAK